MPLVQSTKYRWIKIYYLPVCKHTPKLKFSGYWPTTVEARSRDFQTILSLFKGLIGLLKAADNRTPFDDFIIANYFCSSTASHFMILLYRLESLIRISENNVLNVIPAQLNNVKSMENIYSIPKVCRDLLGWWMNAVVPARTKSSILRKCGLVWQSMSMEG